MEECKHCAKADVLNEYGFCYECMLNKTAGRGSISGSQASVGDSQSSETPTPCLCGAGAMTVKALMPCTNCTRWWHPSCVGLAGLTKTHTKLIKDWKCPLCFAFKGALSVKIKDDLNVFEEEKGESSDLQQEVQKGVKAAIPDIISSIKATLSGEGVMAQPQDTWAQVTQRKEIIREVVEETSKHALEKGMQLMDANLSEQKKRERNAVISGVVEDYGGAGSSLRNVAAELLGNGCSPDDLVTVKRLGVRKPTSKRPILVVFKTEDAAQFFHNYGMGRKVSDRTWINPDLTRTQRNAQFEKRQAKREKYRNRSSLRSSSRRQSEDVEAPLQSDNTPAAQPESDEAPITGDEPHQPGVGDDFTDHTVPSNTD